VRPSNSFAFTLECLSMRIFLLGAFLFLTTLQAQNPLTPTTPSGGINFFSVKQDSEIGSELSKEAERVLPLVRDAGVNRYLYSISQRLRRHLPQPAIPFRIRAVNSRDVNSVAFPGGAIYVDRGLIEVASNEDELAAIVAHEMGHVIARHGTAQLSRQLLVQAPISIAAGLPTTEAWKDQLTRLGISFGVDASFLRYSRDQELEANLMAVRLLTGARYDSNALSAILDNVSDTTFVFNHPRSQNVPEDLDVEIERLSSPAPGRVHANAEFRSLQSTLQKIAYPVVEKEPDVTSDATSSIFAHPMDFYRLGYPSGWLVTRTGPNGAIIAPTDGVQSSRAGDDVTHGVMLDLFDLSVADRALTLDQATNRLIVYLRQNNQSLRIIPGAQRQTLISDEPGLRTVMIGKSGGSNSSEIVWVVTRLYYQSLFYMVFVAPEDEFPSYEPIFEQMIRSTQLR
jgi:beta-barrel assembly-enhancing protease